MFELSIQDAVATLRLDRPEARNAIPLGGWHMLAAEAENAAATGAKVLILAGQAKGAFCAGADLAGFDGFRSDAEACADFRLAMRDGLDRLQSLPIPTIALIEGHCYGAGVALAMACDIRLAGPGAQFAITPAKLGISYPQEDVHRLVALIGPGQASRLLLGAGPIDAHEAVRIGLVEQLAEESGAAAALAVTIAANVPQSLRTLKRAIQLAVAGTAQDDEQDRRFDFLLASDAMQERLAHLRARR